MKRLLIIAFLVAAIGTANAQKKQTSDTVKIELNERQQAILQGYADRTKQITAQANADMDQIQRKAQQEINNQSAAYNDCLKVIIETHALDSSKPYFVKDGKIYYVKSTTDESKQK